MRLGIFARTFARPTLEATLDAVVAHGLDTVQFNPVLLGGPSLPERLDPGDIRRVARAHAERGLEIAAISGTYNMAHPDPARRAQGARRLRALIEAAPRLGTRAVTLCTGTRHPQDMWRGHPDNASAEAWEDMLESVGAAVEAAEAARVTVLVEPEPGNVVGDARAARTLLDRLRSPALRIVIDAANLLPPERLPDQRRVLEEAFGLLAGDIAAAHAKDVRPDGEVVAAGRGCVDYTAYLELLDAAGFAGPLILHGLAEDEVASSLGFLRTALGAR
jgi:sugar phosphate isomerase/epimerase